MTEPQYTYVPGKGWVPLNNILTMKCGTVVRLENRPPKKGERYDCGSVGEYWGTQENPNWGQWVDHFSKHKYLGMCGPVERDRALMGGDVYMTAVPL